MIQLAAAFHHYTRGNLKGTKSLIEAGLDKLRRFPGEYRGASLNALCGAAAGWLETVKRDGLAAAAAEVPSIEFVRPGQSNWGRP